jgi:hypothetical protein
MDTHRCKVDGCTKPVKVLSRQLCGMHYRRWQLGKDLDAPVQERTPNKGRPCSVVECGAPADTKGLCRHHYRRHLRGEPLTGGRRAQSRAPWQVRIWRFIEFGGPVRPGVTSSCWQWISSVDPRTGYGTFGIGAKAAGGGPRTRTGHRMMWQLINGPLPKGLMLDHQCHNRACVNVHHLRLVTPYMNTVHNSGSDAALLSRQTHCKRGHEFTPENTYYNAGTTHRQCRECRRIRDRRRVRTPHTRGA